MASFTSSSEMMRGQIPGGSLAWFSQPTSTGAKTLVGVEVTFDPGGCHSFHIHPSQEELIYVLEGLIEQWVDGEKRTLGPGDTAFIPPGTVHASFNDTDAPSRILAILGPSVGTEGYEAVDVSDQEPWVSIR